MKKQARRLLKRINGVLTVIYVDAETGEQLPSLDGYELVTSDNGGLPNVSTTPSKSTETPQQAPEASSGSSNNSSNDRGHDEWMAKRTPDNDSNPFDEIGEQVKTVQKRVEDGKSTLVNGIIDTAGRGLKNTVGKEAATAFVDGAQSIKEDGLFGIGKATREFGANIKQGVQDILQPNQVSSTTSTSTSKPVSPNEMFSYGDIQTRKLPLSEDWFNQAAAAASAVNPDIRFVISSAGQHQEGQGPRTGGTRHDVDANGQGHTADIHPYINGQKISYDSNPDLYKQLVTSFATVGYTGIGVDQAKGYLHVGGGTPAIWVYDGARDVPAPPDIQEAYNAGVQKNRAGEGERILQAYSANTSPTQPAPTQLADVNPTLLNSVQKYKGATGQPFVAPKQTTLGLGDQLAMAPIQGNKDALPGMDASYNPALKAMVPTVPEPVSSGGIGMVASKLTNYEKTPMTQDQLGELASQDGMRNLDALLMTLNEAEGSPTANTLFGYGKVDDLSQHPNTRVAYNDGKDYSTAAGLFQINKGTWDEFSRKAGVTDFSEESQYKVARAIATEEYKRDTGRDLVTDLSTGNKDYLTQAYNSLANRWSSLPTGSQANSTLGKLMTSYETRTAFAPPSTKDISSDPTVAPTKIKNEPVTSTSVLGIDDATRGVTTPTMAPKSSNSGYSEDKTAAKLASQSSGSSAPTPNSSGFMSDVKTASKQAVQKAAEKQQDSISTYKPSSTPTQSTKTKTPTQSTGSSSGFMGTPSTQTKLVKDKTPDTSSSTKTKTPSSSTSTSTKTKNK